MTTLRTFDVSKNKLQSLGTNIQILANLKSLNCEENKLTSLALQNISKLTKLQTLTAGGNKLGSPVTLKPKTPPKVIPLPSLPHSLKNLRLNNNFFMSFPSSLCSSGPNCLIKLQKLDLSYNDLVVIPEDIQNLKSLVELNLDNNSIIEIPESVGKLTKLKVLSLRRNQIIVPKGMAQFKEKNPPPIHRSVFENTLVVDLNLDGNSMTSSQLHQFDGFDAYLGKSSIVSFVVKYDNKYYHINQANQFHKCISRSKEKRKK